MLRRAWFPGNSDLEMLALIFATLGTPTDGTWAGMRDLPSVIEFERTPAVPLSRVFRGAGEDALDLLSRMVRAIAA